MSDNHAGLISQPTDDRPRDLYQAAVLACFAPRPTHRVRRRPRRRLVPLAALVVAALLGAGLFVADRASGATAPTITYTVHAKPGTPLTVAWTAPGVRYPVVHGEPAYPYRTLVVPASGTLTETVPADGWLGGWDVPVLSALPADGLMPRSDVPGFDCTISQAGVQLARDNEPGQYFCLASTDPAVNR